jgi:hypothetical protein
MKTMLAAAALLTLPFAANAATSQQFADIYVDQGYSFSETVAAGGSGADFFFTIKDDLRINGISVSGSGTNGGTDIGNTTFQIVNPDVGPAGYSLVGTFGTTSSGLGGTDLVTDYEVGDSFSVSFITNPTNAQPISYTVSFNTSPVPVPAAGLLLMTALGGAAAMRRRKKAATA